MMVLMQFLRIGDRWDEPTKHRSTPPQKKSSALSNSDFWIQARCRIPLFWIQARCRIPTDFFFKRAVGSPTLLGSSALSIPTNFVDSGALSNPLFVGTSALSNAPFVGSSALSDGGLLVHARCQIWVLCFMGAPENPPPDNHPPRRRRRLRTEPLAELQQERGERGR